MIAIKVEYEGECVSIALYEGIELEEFIDVITSSLHITGTIIGLRCNNGVILLPKYICQNVNSLPQLSFELLVRRKPGTSPPSRKTENPKLPLGLSYNEPEIKLSQTMGKFHDPQQRRNNEQNVDHDFIQLLKYLQCDGCLTEQEERILLDLFASENPDVIAAYHDFLR